MKFPTGPRQPSQVLAEDVVAACTPESLLGMMRDVALVEGCPIHDKHYVGHATDVTDPPLSRFFMHQLERPRHFENFEIPERKCYFLDNQNNSRIYLSLFQMVIIWQPCICVLRKFLIQKAQLQFSIWRHTMSKSRRTSNRI